MTTVHVLVMFFRAFDTGASRQDAIAFAVGHSGLAIIMTSLTAARGDVLVRGGGAGSGRNQSSAEAPARGLGFELPAAAAAVLRLRSGVDDFHPGPRRNRAAH